MNSEKQDLLSRAVRRKFTPAEERRWEELLEADPALREAFAEEEALERMLGSLPNVPISSNFTALVMGAATRETPAIRRPKFRIPFIQFASGLAFLALIATAGFRGYRNHLRQAE